jgi:ABC-type dipeptide/oligopeptide/nickel transport system permease subunit
MARTSGLRAVPSKESLWIKAVHKFLRDKLGMTALLIVSVYFVVACLVWMGLLGAEWSSLQGTGNDPVSAKYWFGTNVNGQDIFDRAVFSTKTAFEVGIVVAIASTMLGAVLGAFSGFFAGSWIDEGILWICGCIDCIPFYLFVAAIAFALKDNPFAMHIAMIATFWTGTGRLIRGEFIKLKHLEFVESARAIGVGQIQIIFRHMLPNTLHILLVQASLTFVSAIKSEVILSFLGLGVKNSVSWGLMIAESTSEVAYGTFNNFLAASGFMFILVIAFNLFSDALQDALDPKKVS